MLYDTTEIVDEIGEIHLEGDIVPSSWFHHLKMPNKLPDGVGITILARIIYWYRPIPIFDQDRVIGYRKKFKADKLQKSYQQFADEFGFGKEQVRQACKRLVDQGLITIEFRNVVTNDGLTLANIMFVSPIPSAIKRITFNQRNGRVSTSEPIRINSQTDTYQPTDRGVSIPEPIRIDPQIDYTKNTTEITTKSTTQSKDRVRSRANDPTSNNQNTNQPLSEREALIEEALNKIPSKPSFAERPNDHISAAAKFAQPRPVEKPVKKLKSDRSEDIREIIADHAKQNHINYRQWPDEKSPGWKKISNLLDKYSKEDLLLANKGCAINPWNNGTDPDLPLDGHGKPKKYNQLTVTFRDSDQVERFIAIAEETESPHQPTQQEIEKLSPLEIKKRQQKQEVLAMIRKREQQEKEASERKT